MENSLHDADLYLTVAESLASGTPRPSTLGNVDADVATLLEMVSSQALQEFPLFGRGAPEIQDFSQFKPRGHYTKSRALERYFRTMMWLGRIDFRVAGPKNFASPRELGTALILRDALIEAKRLVGWEAADRILQTFVGLSDFMTVPQLSSILDASGLESVADVQSLAQLKSLQEKIEASEVGVQSINSSGLFVVRGNGPIKLPRSFALFGQRFVMDSWALSKVVFDQVSWKGQDISRRLPSSVDVAFTVLGNAAAPQILASRIENNSGVPFRDGYPIQHHLGALRDVFDKLGPEEWHRNVYTSWLHTLRQWSSPLDDSIPEVFRTREWAKRTMASQLASWTHLRHNTVLYAKQSVSPPVLCSFPHTYLEPNLGAWESLTAMAKQMTSEIARSAPSTFAIQHVQFLSNFGKTCETLTEIVRKQNLREEITEKEDLFLKDMVEIMVDYVGQRTYSGWYPSLYYISKNPSPFPFGEEAPNQHPSDIWDPVVTDVHTDFPSPPDGDPGTILHQGVGNTAMLFVSVNCTERRMYSGPVATYYEFTSGPGNFDRMTDEEWQDKVRRGNQPDEPEWAQGHRFPGKVTIPSYAISRNR